MNKRRSLLLIIISYLLPLALWALLSLLIGSTFLPPPWTTVSDGITLLLSSTAWYNLGLTFLRVAIGFASAFAAGLVLGILRGTYRTLEILTDPLVHFFQGVPPLLWAIPIFFIAGFGFLPPALAIALIVLPLVIVNVSQGMKTLPRELSEMLFLFAPKKTAFLRELVFPQLVPALVASLKLGIALAVKSSIIAEFFGASDGAGFMINAAFQTGRIRSLFAWGVIIILFIFISDIAVRLILFLVLPDRDKKRLCDAQILHRSANIKSAAASRVPAPPVALQMKNISFSYNRTDDSPLFSKLSLAVKRNEIGVIAGDSGVGKTTLLKLIAGFFKSASGNIRATRQAVSFMFQEDRLLPRRTALYNAALPLVARGVNKVAAFRRAARLLLAVGLAGFELYFPDELSGGMKRRLCLARCFAMPPSLVLLDEPFHGLHKKARSDLWQVFLALWKQSPCPAVFVTHYPEEIPRSAFLKRYRLEGRPADLVKRKKH